MIVVAACNEAYLPGALAALNSVRAHSDCELGLMLYGHPSLLREIPPDINVVLNYPLPEFPRSSSLWPVIGPEMYARVAVPHAFENERALYLDSDCIVVGDISDLATRRLAHSVASAIYGDPKTHQTYMQVSHRIDDAPKTPLSRAQWRRPDEQWLSTEEAQSPIACTGVLLFDCAAWRRDNLYAKTFDVLSRPLDFKTAIQAGFCIALRGRFDRLTPEYHYPVRAHTGPDALTKASILHYVSFKPWLTGSAVNPAMYRIWRKYA